MSCKEITPPKKTKGLETILKAALQPTSTQKELQNHVKEEMTKYDLLPSIDMDSNPLVWCLARKYVHMALVCHLSICFHKQVT